MTHYWIGVVSRSHVQRGVEGGFAQLCHGKCAPLKKMKAGDWLIYYSPRTDFQNGEPLRHFTALGRIINDTVYQVAMSEDFIPFRRDVDFLPCHAAPIHPLLGELSFIPNLRQWGYPFRRGHFEISEADFRLIAAAMRAEIPQD
ncbi:MAG: EVE domain-containing protein [Chloroflexi bacterium]|nr:EVE domain-containing protein [Chloroflexota bacterium]